MLYCMNRSNLIDVSGVRKAHKLKDIPILEAQKTSHALRRSFIDVQIESGAPVCVSADRTQTDWETGTHHLVLAEHRH